MNLFYFSKRIQIIVCLTLLFRFAIIKSQEINDINDSGLNVIIENAYGYDQNLINGRQYYNFYPKAPGHAFWGQDLFRNGNISINGVKYNNVFLKYDICNQEVLLDYENSYGGRNQIVLLKSKIDSFSIINSRFVKYTFANTGTKFYQVITNSQIKCLYYWEKKLVKDATSVESYYSYSDEGKKMYLLYNNKLIQYRGNKSFIKIFPEKYQSKIKKYLKNNHLKVSKLPERKVIEVITFCEGLINNIEG